MNVLMIGVDETSIGGMLTVVNNYKNNKEFCEMTNLKYIATVIRSNKLVKIKTFLCKIPEIVSTIRNDKIDIVHVHMAERGSVFREGFVVLLANVMGCKTVIHMHGADIEDWYNKQFVLIKKLIANIFCAADVMIVLGDNWLPFMRSVMVGHEEKIKVLHNAVYVEAENKANANATDILFYGMLIKRKGIEDLLAAFEKIKDDIPKNIHLRLYGDNKEFDVLKKLKEYHLEERTSYEGWMTSEKRQTVFSNTLINVLPSYNEGFPMTILESMGYGIPNISTNIAAIPEAITDGVNGFTIEPGDVDSLAEKMKSLILHKDLWVKFSNNAYETAKNEFSIKTHFAQLMKIYEQIM